jgi:4a-hydroxytetrahydrobiopterin dehydratase
MDALTESQLAEAQRELQHWTYDRGRRALHRCVQSKDFSQTIGIMMRVAIEAEKADHHPEWSNVYNRLDVWLTTHSARGVSYRDVAMARCIDAIVQN